MWYDGSYCPCCMSKLKESDYNIHHCLIYINGLPAAGDNHLKSSFDFQHYAVARGYRIRK